MLEVSVRQCPVRHCPVLQFQSTRIVVQSLVEIDAVVSTISKPEYFALDESFVQRVCDGVGVCDAALPC